MASSPARLVLALITGVLLLAAAPAPSHAASCDVWGSPDGRNGASGTLDAPLRDAQAVIDRLGPGETGCLRGGTYAGELTGPYVARFGRSGRAGAPIVLRSAPGERATLRGIVTVPDGSDHVTIADLDIDGRRTRGGGTPTSVQVMGDHTTLSGTDITNHGTTICVGLGYPGWGKARHTRIVGNTFRDCGDDRKRMQDHAVYADWADHAVVRRNLFVRTAAWAVHLYPNARGFMIDHNVMVDNGGGVVFAGEGREASVDNRVVANVIVGSRRGAGIESWWGGRVGRGNTARSNCLSGNRTDVDTRGGGFTASGNLSTAIRFGEGYTLAPGSPCLTRLKYDPMRGR